MGLIVLVLIAMSLTCTKIPPWMKWSNLVKNRNNDFWLSSLADVSEEDLPDKMKTYRVEESIAGDIFSQCYYRHSKDIKTDADSIVDEVGLGLRKSRVKSKSASGCVFILVKNDGPSLLFQQKAT